MIALGKVKEIERLLAQGGISQRKIALQVGVSRATVSAIVTGARPDYQARVRAIADEPLPDGPLGHCPTCGATVYMPCRLCHVRRKMREEEELLAARRRELRETAVRHLLHKVRLAHWKREGINPAENKVPRERTAEQEPWPDVFVLAETQPQVHRPGRGRLQKSHQFAADPVGASDCR